MTKTTFIPDESPDRCYICGRWKKYGEHFDEHHIFGGPCRKISTKYGFVVTLCRDCHNLVHSKDGVDLKDMLHQRAQKIYEEQIGSREQFIKDFIRSYL